jgi:acyl transferase domain-containing protein
MQRATGLGKMLAVECSPEEAEGVLTETNVEASVAAINAPRSVVLAGAPGAIDAAFTAFATRGIPSRPLRANYAFHCSQMDPIRDELERAIADVRPARSRVRLVSTVTGALIDGTEMTAGYWGRNLREPVAFSAAVAGLVSEGSRAFLEIAPHPVLGMNLTEHIGADGLVLASMRREKARATFLASVAALYSAGANVGWRALCPPDAHRTRIPTYAWSRERFWRPTSTPGAGPSVARADAIDAEATLATTPVPDDAPSFAALLLDEPPRRRASRLLAHVRGEIAAVLRLDPASLDPMAPLGTLGLDSLMSVEVKTRLERSLGVPLSPTLIWSHPTIAALVPFLAEKIGVPLEEARAPEAAPAPAAKSGDKLVSALARLRALKSEREDTDRTGSAE